MFTKSLCVDRDYKSWFSRHGVFISEICYLNMNLKKEETMSKKVPGRVLKKYISFNEKPKKQSCKLQ